MYVGPGGSTAFGKRYQFPSATAPKPATAPTATNTKGVPGGGFNTSYASPQSIAAAANAGTIDPASAPKQIVQTSPGSPGVKTAPVPPFMTGQNVVDYGDAFKSRGDQIAQADKDLGDIKASAQTALYNIGRNYLIGTDNTQNDAAGRGIFQSSIKDGALADLAATKATMSSDVNTRVNNAQLFHDDAIKRINDWWGNFQEGMNAIQATNAAEAGKDAPPYSEEPTPATYAPAPAPAAAAATPQTYTGPKYSLSQPGRAKYRLGGY